MDSNVPADSQSLVGQNEAVAPPYVSFNTFRTLLDWLKSEGVPLRFDRSFWHAKFSGSTGTDLKTAAHRKATAGEAPAVPSSGIHLPGSPSCQRQPI